MKRQSPYGDANMMNSYGASQMQQASLRRTQQNPGGVNNYSGQMGSFAREEDRSYAFSANSDDQWHWDRDTEQMSPELHREGKVQGDNTNRSFYQNQMSDPKHGLNQEQRLHPQEKNVELGREDNPSLITFEGLEKKFSDEIMKLSKEFMDAEDAENARHREKILEINNQYQEKLVALRARHTARREELLRKESQARLQQYQLTTMRQYPNEPLMPPDMPPQARHGGFAGAPGEPHHMRPLAGRGGHFNSQRQRRPESIGQGRMQGMDSRATPSSGRGQNTGGGRYY